MTNVMHNFSMYLFIFLTLYMFRAHRAHHQERQIVSIQPTQSDSYQRLYWHNLDLLMMSTMCLKHVELKIEKIVRHGCHLPRIITWCMVNKIYIKKIHSDGITWCI